MPPTLRIKITMKDGAVFEVEKDLDDAKVFLADVEHNGYSDRGRFYSTDSILTIAVGPPTDYPGDSFSMN